jgi:hypothetical protein
MMIDPPERGGYPDLGRRAMNSELRRRIDEVHDRLTQLRDSL